MRTPPSVFVSYSHQDMEWKTRIVDHLSVLELEGHFDIWDDSRIEAGGDWLTDIERALAAARVALLLVSVRSLTSPFIRNTEVPDLLRRRADEGLKLIPVIVRQCPWEEVSWLRKIRAFPFDGKALSALSEHEVDEQLTLLAREVKKGLSDAVPPMQADAASTATRTSAHAPSTSATVAATSSGATNAADSDSLVLLCDFYRAYRGFEWATAGGMRWIPDDVVHPMRDAVSGLARECRVLLRMEVIEAISNCKTLIDAYPVTLDGRAFFRNATRS